MKRTKLLEKTFELIKNNINAEITVFLVLLVTKLFLFNQMLDGSSIWNISLLASITGTVLMMLCWTSLIPLALRVLMLYIINCVASFIIISDLVFYRYFSDIISMPVLTQASNVTSVRSSVVSLFHGYDLIFVIDLLIIPIVLFFTRSSAKAARGKYTARLIRFAAAAVTGIALFSFGMASLLKSQPHIFTSFYDRVYIVQNIGLLSFHSIDAYKFVKSRDKDKTPLSEEKKNDIKEFLLEKKKQLPEEPKLYGAGKGMNLIVIQVEALQGFVINRRINGQEITPNLNRLVNESIYFDNYYTETAGGGTSDAEFLSNVSLFPAREGSVYIRYSGNEHYSLAKKLKGEGYRTAAMHAYKAGFWNRSIMYRSLGFDEFVSKNDYEQDEIIGMGLSDRSFFRQSLEKLKAYKEPYYGFLITLTSHYPFDNDKKYYSSFDVGEYKDSFFGNYLESIHYADEALGYFINGLENEGLTDRSVIAIYGDHFAIPKDKKENLAKYLGIKDMNDFNWVKLQKVPLLIHFPGGSYKGENHTAGGGADFMPTILNIMGIESHDMPMLGRDLLNSEDGLAVLRHGYFMTNKYISLTSDGVAFEAETGRNYPLEKLKTEKELTKKLLEYSDIIIENNLAGEIREYLNR